MTTPCPAARASDTPCAHPAGDGHQGQCHDQSGSQRWSRSESWFTPEASADDDGLEWL